MPDLPLSHYYPIEISCKAEPIVAQFSEGLRQLSGFESLKSAKLNYLLDFADRNSLISTLDSAAGSSTFGWQFRPHYALKQWIVSSYSERILDDERLYDISIDLAEIRTALPFTPPTAPLTLDLTPDEPPTITSNYRVRSPQLGYFPDRRPEPINPKVEKIDFTSTLELNAVDSIDLLLERCRGVYPLLWQGKTYTCPSWSIAYHPECATLTISLETLNLY